MMQSWDKMNHLNSIAPTTKSITYDYWSLSVIFFLILLAQLVRIEQ